MPAPLINQEGEGEKETGVEMKRVGQRMARKEILHRLIEFHR